MSRLTQSTGSLLGFIDDIDMSKISSAPLQVRERSVEGIRELAASIDEKGLLQPILVRLKADSYEIVCGHRRYDACRQLGWKKITCQIVELSDREAYEVSLTENIQRKTLSPIEEAKAFKTYISDFGWGGATQLAGKLGKSVSYVTKRVALLDLPPQVQQAIGNQTFSASIAEELHSIKDPSRQTELAHFVIRKKLSMRKVRQLVDSVEELDESTEYILENKEDHRIRQISRSLDKSIIALRIAMNRLGAIINELDEDGDWSLRETLMQHKRMLHEQIDLLIRARTKFLKGR